jgi:hypothetical protein
MTYWCKSARSGAIEVRPGYKPVIMVGDTIPVLIRFGFAHNGVIYFDGIAIIEGQDYREKELTAKVYIPEDTAIPSEDGQTFPIMTREQFLAQRDHVMNKLARIPVELADPATGKPE